MRFSAGYPSGFLLEGKSYHCWFGSRENVNITDKKHIKTSNVWWLFLIQITKNVLTKGSETIWIVREKAYCLC